MNRRDDQGLDPSAMLRVLDVTRRLAGPFDLTELLTQIIDAGRLILDAQRGSVFLYAPDTRELFSTVATGEQEIRFSIDRGIAGQCARDRATISVPDCYSDPRFNQEVDRKTGFRTRCLIAVPLIGLDEELVGVMQLLNPVRGCTSEQDELIAEALAGQAAVAIQRVRLLEERLVKLKLERDLALAKQIQMNVLPKRLPDLRGYSIASYAKPADETGGDIYDVIHFGSETPGVPESLILLLADATGHGIGPALSVTQVRAMLRIAIRLGADITPIVNHINQQVTDDLESGRFVTAFFGRLDLHDHRLEYHAAGQGPILHFHADGGSSDLHPATTLPLGVLPDMTDPSATLTLKPGDVVVLLTDGVYEYQNAAGQEMGAERVCEAITANSGGPAQNILDAILAELRRHAADAPQRDDITCLVLKRTA